MPPLHAMPKGEESVPGLKVGGWTPRILVVDDHAVVRRGILQILAGGFPGSKFSEACSAPEALDMVWRQDWDLILLDISLPGRSGIEVLKEIRTARPKVPVLILSMHSEDQFAVRALKAGASGYVTKESPPEVVLEAIRRILAGGKFITPTLAEKLATHLNIENDRQPHEALSDREFEVLRLIGSGKTVGEIGEQLCLSVKTISTYRVRLLEKMGLNNNAELVQYCVRNNIVE